MKRRYRRSGKKGILYVIIEKRWDEEEIPEEWKEGHSLCNHREKLG